MMDKKNKMVFQKDILLSINPNYCKRIQQGKKEWEYRKSIWSNNKRINKIYLYETSPIQKIIGYFKTNLIIKGNPKKIWNLTFEEAGITKREFDTYFSNKETGYALQISHLVLFEFPKDPFVLIENFHPPQNFMYFNNNLSKEI